MVWERELPVSLQLTPNRKRELPLSLIGPTWYAESDKRTYYLQGGVWGSVYEPKTSITGIISNVGRKAATVIDRAEVQLPTVGGPRAFAQPNNFYNAVLISLFILARRRGSN